MKKNILLALVALAVIPCGSLAEENCPKALVEKAWVPENQPENRWNGSAIVPEPGPVELPGFISEKGKVKGFIRHGVILGPNAQFQAAFNPTAWVSRDTRDNKEKVFLVVRGEQELSGAGWKRKSLPYLMTSEDGIHFTPYSDIHPIFEATEWYEKAGGIEDPRYFDMRLQPYVDARDGKSFDAALLYTAFDGKTARIAVAYFNHSDPSLYRKGGLLFDPADVRRNPIVAENPEWNKSPSALQFQDPLTGKIRNILFAGEGAKNQHGGIMSMESDRPMGWKWPRHKKPVIQTENGLFTQNLVEPAFQPVIAPLPLALAAKTGQTHGIYLSLHGDSPPHGYQVGFQIFSLTDPLGAPIYKSKAPYLRPEKDYEINGQVGKVVFASGSVEYKGRRIIYYGAGDKVIGAISAEAAK